MPSPVPRHATTDVDLDLIGKRWRDHVVDVFPDPSNGVKVDGSGSHRAKFAPGLATELVRLAASKNIGDPMCGVGTLAHETKIPMALNDLDARMSRFLAPPDALPNLARSGDEDSLEA